MSEIVHRTVTRKSLKRTFVGSYLIYCATVLTDFSKLSVKILVWEPVTPINMSYAMVDKSWGPLVNKKMCFPWFYHMVSRTEWLCPWGDFKWVKKCHTLRTVPEVPRISLCCCVLNEIRLQVWKMLIRLVSSRFAVMRKEYLCTP